MFLAGHEKKRRTRRMSAVPTDSNGRAGRVEAEQE